MSLKVLIDEATMRHAEVEAAARGEASRNAGVADQRVGLQSGQVMDLVGLLGEIGFSKIFGLDRDDTVFARSGGVDFFAKNGQAIEVKSSHHANPHLLVPAYPVPEWAGGGHGTKEYIDIYVLMRIDYNARAVSFMGWAERGDLIRPDRLEHFRGSSRLSFVLPPDQMRQLDPEVERAVAEEARKLGNDVTAETF